MSNYRDPYAGQQHGDAEFNPYSNPQPHASYEAGAYDHFGPARQDNSYPASSPKRRDIDEVSSGFDRGEFGSPRGEKAQNFGQYRREFRDENVWTKGGRGRCIGRFVCCTLLIAIFMIVSIILALALWIRPPNIVIGSAGLTSGGTSAVQLQNTGIIVPLEVNISVSNPNYFSVGLKKVNLDLTYPLSGNNTDIGNGTKTGVTFHSNSHTNFTFPFDIDYEFADDPNYAILIDMATKCGVLSGTKSDLTVDYKITIDLSILSVHVSPTISNSFSIACPFDESTLQKFVDQLGLGSVLGSS